MPNYYKEMKNVTHYMFHWNFNEYRSSLIIVKLASQVTQFCVNILLKPTYIKKKKKHGLTKIPPKLFIVK